MRQKVYDADAMFRRFPEDYYAEVKRVVMGPEFHRSGVLVHSASEEAADVHSQYLRQILGNIILDVYNANEMTATEIREKIKAAKDSGRKVIIIDTKEKFDEGLYDVDVVRGTKVI